MNYKIRHGIIRTKICGVQMLVPTREASEKCPNVMQLSLISSIVWETIEKNMPMEKAHQACKILLRKSDEEVDARIKTIIDHFCEKGFLVIEGDAV